MSLLEKYTDKWVLYQFALIALILFSTPFTHNFQDLSVVLIGLALFGLGVLILVISYFDLGASFTPLPKPKEEGQLVTTGIYGWVRHPMYTGLLLCAFGWSILWGNWFGFILSIVLIYILDGKASYEEQLLEEKFHEYSAYKIQTKKFIPFLY